MIINPIIPIWLMAILCVVMLIMKRRGRWAFVRQIIIVILVFISTTLIISKKPGNTGISRDIRTEFTTDLLLSD